MIDILVVAGIALCAVQTIRAQRLLISALWLAGASALVSILMYLMGAPELAVIELSVGAGLVTILFVFAISIAGDDVVDSRPLIPRPVAWVLVILSAGLLGWMALPIAGVNVPGANQAFAIVLWQQRGLDVLMQIVLIFAGIMGVLGLLSEAKAPAQAPQHKAAIAPVVKEPERQEVHA